MLRLLDKLKLTFDLYSRNNHCALRYYSCAAVYASDSAIFYYKPSSLRVIEWLISSFKSPKHHSKIILINSFLDSGDEKTFCSAGSLRQMKDQGNCNRTSLTETANWGSLETFVTLKVRSEYPLELNLFCCT